jgi:tetrahydromethanopterin S-methyltransferase subunit G
MLMAVMMSPRENWTDERLDDLSKKVDQGFSEVKTEMREGFARMEARFEKIDKRFEKIDKRFEKVDERFERIDERFHDLNRTLLGGAVVIIATLVGGTLF